MPSNFIFFIGSFSCSVIISKCCRRKWAVTSTFIAKRHLWDFLFVELYLRRSRERVDFLVLLLSFSFSFSFFLSLEVMLLLLLPSCMQLFGVIVLTAAALAAVTISDLALSDAFMVTLEEEVESDTVALKAAAAFKAKREREQKNQEINSLPATP